MKLAALLSVMFVSAIIFFARTSHSSFAPDFARKIGPSVAPYMDDGDARFPILVILKKQADLSSADKAGDKVSKGQIVYDLLRQTALESQTPLVQWLDKKKIKYRRYYIMNMVALEEASPNVVKEIAARDDVAKIIGNPKLKNEGVIRSMPLATVTKRAGGVEENITATGAPKVWSELNVKGEGIVVAGQDTGVQWDHPALKRQYRGYSESGVSHAYNWHDSIHESILPAKDNPCGFDTQAPCDDDQHGTHTMGTIVGDDGGTNKVGMAPGAKWIACRNMDRGTGRPTTYIECFEFFLAPYAFGGDPMKDGDPSKAPDVVNNSWGCPPDEGCEGNEMIPVLQAMAKAGIMIVASAGNDGSSCSTIKDPPAQLTGLTLSVGAYDHRDGKIAYFSSRGPSKYDNGPGPDVVAPGIDVRSSVPGNEYEGFFSGTSMSGPHVVGEVALLWSADHSLIGNIAGTIDVVRKTATPVKAPDETCGGISGDKIPNNTYGWGVINAYAAVKSRRSP